MMKYEFTAGTIRILKNCKQVARLFRLHQINIVCLLRALLDEPSVMLFLEQVGANVGQLCKGVEDRLKHKDFRRGLSKDEEAMPLTFIIDEVCMRVIREAAVVYLKQKEAIASESIFMLLAIANDLENEGKQLLAENSVDYYKMKSVLEASYNYSDDEMSTPFPNEDDGRKGRSGTQSKVIGGKANSDTPMLDSFGSDLTDLAAKGILDPVVGRNNEIKRIVQILCRRKKNNPILLGNPGVGKSAVVEGLAQRIVCHKVPRSLQNKRIISLELASVVAGTQYRGQFEERLRRLIQELREHTNIILFIDEIHTIIGAGSAPGSLDAANILKPALARGEIQCVGATTTGEYKKTIEKDGALERRFQKIILEPTNIEDTCIILQNIKSRYEEHHNVTYTKEALEACVRLTARYIQDRELPDKAIDAMDEAGSRKHLQSSETPLHIEEKEKEIEELRERKMEAAREQNYEQAANLRDAIVQATKELDASTGEWMERRKNSPSIVGISDVAEVVSVMSGVPLTRVETAESIRLKGLGLALRKQVIAQDTAIDHLSRAIARSRLGLKGHERPIGTFLFVGPTGVGKTHLVKCLAEWMFGSKDSLIRIDMSEYGEKYSVSRLLGAPPGYVGYDEGGQLTEQVRRHPYSVVLFDEIEKGHSDVFNTLLQVMDEGRLTDGNGVTVDFKNTIIILTSNSGTRQLREFGNGVGFERRTDDVNGAVAEDIVLRSLRKQFAPEFLNRLDDIIMFNPLNKESALKIVALELEKMKDRLHESGFDVSVSERVNSFLVEKGFDANYGARSLKRAIQRYVEDALCDFLLENATCHKLMVDVNGEHIKVLQNHNIIS